MGIPPLIFLPGLIILVIISSFLKSYFKFLETINVKEPLFWVISISIGLLVTYLYSNISDIFGGSNHNLYRNYGLEDIVIIWTGSVIFSIAISLIVFGILNNKILSENAYLPLRPYQ